MEDPIAPMKRRAQAMMIEAKLTWSQMLKAIQHNDAGPMVWKELTKRIRSLTEKALRSQNVLEAVSTEDVTQMLLMKIASPQGLTSFIMAESPQAYLSTAVRNAVVDLVRQRGAEARAVLRYLVARSTEEKEPTHQLEKQELIAKVLEGLTQEDQLLLRLKFWEDLSNSEIAARLGVSYSAAAVKISRLLNNLRRRFVGSELRL
jgi:RNA polymerase sigma factor (sigma-70 family)